MNFNKISRIVICLVLVCALVVNISPIKAEASTLATAALWVAAPVAVAAMFQVVGVMVGSDTAAFNEAVNNCVTWLTETTSYVVDGMINVVGFFVGDGTTRSYIVRDLLDSVLGWAFDSGTVSPLVDTVPANSTYVFHEGSEYTVTGECVVFRFNYIDVDNSNYHRYFEALVKTSSSGVIKSAAGNSVNSSFTFNDRSYTYAYISQTSFASSYPSLTAGSVNLGTLNQGSATDNIKYALSTLMTSYLAGEYDSSCRAEGLVLGQISAPEDGLHVDELAAYVDYGLGLIQLPGHGYADPDQEEEQLAYLPVSIPSLEYDEVVTQTQEEAQLGQTELEFEFQETEIQTQGLLQNILQTVIQIPGLLQDIGQKIIQVPGQIFNGLGQILTDALTFLFVPEQTFVQTKVQTLTQEFAFASSLVTSAKAISTGLSGITTQPPIIYIDLGANRSSHYLGGKVVFMDLTWYAEYKASVDTIISAFLWICFIWRMLLKLPGIIGGMPGDWVMGTAHFLGIDNHLPTRNAAYEVTRAANREYIRKGSNK